MQGTLWKNNLNFVKDVPTKCVNLIVTVNIVSEKKSKIYFCAELLS